MDDALRALRGPLPRSTGVLLLLAVLWGVLLVGAAFLAPAYSTSTCSATPDGQGSDCLDSTATLVQANGVWGALVLAVPLALAAVVAACLRAGTRPAAIAAWSVTLLLVGFCVVAVFSVGVFLAPMATLLVVACAQQSAASPRAGTATA